MSDNLPTPKQRRKYYQERRAYADGWGIEYLFDGKWNPIASSFCCFDGEYRIVPDANGWLPWYPTGDSVCPFTNHVVVDYLTGSGLAPIRSMKAGELNWDISTTLTHYRPHRERKLVKTVKHFDDGTTEVQP